MHGEKDGGDQARPLGVGRTPQQQKQKNGIQRMDQDVGPVLAGRICAEQGEINGRGQPGHGMPVTRFDSLEGPFEGVPRQSRFYMQVRADVGGIVVIRKGCPPNEL